MIQGNAVSVSGYANAAGPLGNPSSTLEQDLIEISIPATSSDIGQYAVINYCMTGSMSGALYNRIEVSLYYGKMGTVGPRQKIVSNMHQYMNSDLSLGPVTISGSLAHQIEVIPSDGVGYFLTVKLASAITSGAGSGIVKNISLSGIIMRKTGS